MADVLTPNTVDAPQIVFIRVYSAFFLYILSNILNHQITFYNVVQLSCETDIFHYLPLCYASFFFIAGENYISVSSLRSSVGIYPTEIEKYPLKRRTKTKRFIPR